MAKKPQGQKGFLDELGSPTALPAGKPGFGWQQPIVKPSADPMNMPTRMSRNSKSPSGRSNIVKEQKKIQGK